MLIQVEHYDYEASERGLVSLGGELAIAAGPQGLRRVLLSHLVQRRYASAIAGNFDFGGCTLRQAREVAGHGTAPTVEHVLGALAELEERGLVKVVSGFGSETGWQATAAGVVAVNAACELPRG